MSENKGLFDDGSDEEYKPVELDQQQPAAETSNPYGEDQN